MCAAAGAARPVKKVMKVVSNYLDIDIVAKVVDDIVHPGAPVVTLGLEILVLFRPTCVTNQQKVGTLVQLKGEAKRLGPNEKQNRVGREMYLLAAALRS